MKLDWKINECRVLKAKVGETTYFVSPGVRIPETLTPEQLEFMEWVRRPPWWRPIARRKHDRRERGFLFIRMEPAEGLADRPIVLEYRRFPPRRPPWWRPVARWKYDRRKK